MTNLSELAARVEALTGPDREVDAEIATALGLPWDYAADWGPRGKEKPRAFPYTASIDAAMTLVPEGHDWSVSSEQGRGVAYTIGEGIFAADTVAKTPALALTAAALRGLATPQENSNG